MTTPDSSRYACIHGHFYQPPRENPWLGAVEVEDSAAPYHDWNERIAAECYASNTAARLVNDRNEILDIVNNFSRMSFNVGPTLLSWLERARPEVYAAILAADRESRERYDGHGSALAQIYNHVIMPLQTREEQQLQIAWGLADFRHRFRREPEGLWLPETAVDLETLTLLAQAGIRFVILSPFQAKRVRGPNGEWQEVSGGRINPRQPYICRLPPDQGRAMVIFFYDAPISRAVAFEGLLSKGEALVQRLQGAFIAEDGAPQLVHIATDGESYGHHHRFGEMALAFALHHMERLANVRLINYGAFLDRHPPTMDVELIERSSWSCFHGIERWRADCGCRIGRFPSWHQKWRGPLREALDGLAQRVDRIYTEQAAPLIKDPRAAVVEYVEVLLQPTPERREAFLRKHLKRAPASGGPSRVWSLLEMVRFRHLMYTSCGWFFDDISGLETVQILKYACRSLQFAQQLSGYALEPEFRERLARAPGNLAWFRDGGVVYDRLVKPLQTDLPRVVAHYGISSMTREQPASAQLYDFAVDCRDYHRAEVTGVTLALGHVAVTSQTTAESGELLFAVVHGGGQAFHCIVHPSADDQAYTRLKEALTNPAPASADELVARLAQWGDRVYTLKDLFLEERRKVLRHVIQDTVDQYESVYRELYGQHKDLLGTLKEVGLPLPDAFRIATHHVLQQRVEIMAQRVHDEVGMLSDVPHLHAEADAVQLDLDMQALELRIGEVVMEHVEILRTAPDDLRCLAYVVELLESAARVELQPQLWQAQNIFFDVYRRGHAAATWSTQAQEAVARLGRALHVAEAARMQEQARVT